MENTQDVSNHRLFAGFEQAVKDSNKSELGQRNGSNMLSVQASERALLCYLIGRLNSLDPDVLVGHNVSAFDLDILLHRLQHHKVYLIAYGGLGFTPFFISAACYAFMLKHSFATCAHTSLAPGCLLNRWPRHLLQMKIMPAEPANARDCKTVQHS